MMKFQVRLFWVVTWHHNPEDCALNAVTRFLVAKGDQGSSISMMTRLWAG